MEPIADIVRLTDASFARQPNRVHTGQPMIRFRVRFSEETAQGPALTRSGPAYLGADDPFARPIYSLQIQVTPARLQWPW